MSRNGPEPKRLKTASQSASLRALGRIAVPTSPEMLSPQQQSIAVGTPGTWMSIGESTVKSLVRDHHLSTQVHGMIDAISQPELDPTYTATLLSMISLAKPELFAEEPQLSRLIGILISSPSVFVSILTVSIIYRAMEPKKTWPAALVDAWAADSMGSRLWVDHSSSRAFVSNILTVVSDKRSRFPNDTRDGAIQCALQRIGVPSAPSGDRAALHMYKARGLTSTGYKTSVALEGSGAGSDVLITATKTSDSRIGVAMRVLAQLAPHQMARSLAAVHLRAWASSTRFAREASELMTSLASNTHTSSDADLSVVSALLYVRQRRLMPQFSGPISVSDPALNILDHNSEYIKVALQTLLEGEAEQRTSTVGGKLMVEVCRRITKPDETVGYVFRALAHDPSLNITTLMRRVMRTCQQAGTRVSLIPLINALIAPMTHTTPEWMNCIADAIVAATTMSLPREPTDTNRQQMMRFQDQIAYMLASAQSRCVEWCPPNNKELLMKLLMLGDVNRECAADEHRVRSAPLRVSFIDVVGRIATMTELGADAVDVIQSLLLRAAKSHPAATLVTNTSEAVLVPIIESLISLSLSDDTVYWKTQLVLVLAAACDPKGAIGAILWRDYPSCRELITRLITHDFTASTPTTSMEYHTHTLHQPTAHVLQTLIEWDRMFGLARRYCACRLPIDYFVSILDETGPAGALKWVSKVITEDPALLPLLSASALSTILLSSRSVLDNDGWSSVVVDRLRRLMASTEANDRGAALTTLTFFLEALRNTDRSTRRAAGSILAAIISEPWLSRVVHLPCFRGNATMARDLLRDPLVDALSSEVTLDAVTAEQYIVALGEDTATSSEEMKAIAVAVARALTYKPSLASSSAMLQTAAVSILAQVPLTDEIQAGVAVLVSAGPLANCHTHEYTLISERLMTCELTGDAVQILLTSHDARITEHAASKANTASLLDMLVTRCCGVPLPCISVCCEALSRHWQMGERDINHVLASLGRHRVIERLRCLSHVSTLNPYINSVYSALDSSMELEPKKRMGVFSLPSRMYAVSKHGTELPPSPPHLSSHLSAQSGQLGHICAQLMDKSVNDMSCIEWRARVFGSGDRWVRCVLSDVLCHAPWHTLRNMVEYTLSHECNATTTLDFVRACIDVHRVWQDMNQTLVFTPTQTQTLYELAVKEGRQDGDRAILLAYAALQSDDNSKALQLVAKESPITDKLACIIPTLISTPNEVQHPSLSRHVLALLNKNTSESARVALHRIAMQYPSLHGTMVVLLGELLRGGDGMSVDEFIAAEWPSVYDDALDILATVSPSLYTYTLMETLLLRLLSVHGNVSQAMCGVCDGICKLICLVYCTVGKTPLLSLSLSRYMLDHLIQVMPNVPHVIKLYTAFVDDDPVITGDTDVSLDGLSSPIRSVRDGAYKNVGDALANHMSHVTLTSLSSLLSRCMMSHVSSVRMSACNLAPRVAVLTNEGTPCHTTHSSFIGQCRALLHGLVHNLPHSLHQLLDVIVKLSSM